MVAPAGTFHRWLKQKGKLRWPAVKVPRLQNSQTLLKKSSAHLMKVLADPIILLIGLQFTLGANIDFRKRTLAKKTVNYHPTSERMGQLYPMEKQYRFVLLRNPAKSAALFRDISKTSAEISDVQAISGSRALPFFRRNNE